jgi:class 3 adenylate cyclase/YHS domain-containing protein
VLRQWRALGLLGRDDVTTFEPADVQRARLIRLLLGRGVALDTLVQAERAQGILGRHLEVPEQVGPICSRAEAAERIGLEVGVLERLVEAARVGEADQPLSADDEQLLRGAKVMLDSGLPEEALVQLLRVYADALSHVAEAESRLFHFYVHERLRAQGLSSTDLMAVTDEARKRMLPLVEPTLLYFHRKGFARAVEDDALLHLQEDAGLPAPGQLKLTVAFVDLASFTPLAEVMGDESAARVLARFSQLVHDAVGRCDGRVVKQIGDAFMLVFFDARAAVTCALDIERRARAEPQFPAVRSGVQSGDVLYRGGEYVGANVNIAARVAAAAQRHQVLVTTAVKDEAGAVPGAEFVPLGRVALKGIAEELELFAVAAECPEGESQRLVDPVCGIELRPGAAAARLVWEGEERFFCCRTCLHRFVEAPERYRSGSVSAGS